MKYLILTFFSALFIQLSVAQNTPTLVPYKTEKNVLDGFMDKRFGMFIHWGPVSLRGTEIGWSRTSVIPKAEYDELYHDFNPALFDADVWVKTAKQAGMKYITITAKHHDGFCLWPTKFTSYNIMNTPFKKDVVGALAKACNKYGIKLCIYYTVLDWYDTRYPIRVSDSKPETTGNMVEFVQLMKNQLNELVTNYHPYMLWFDGNWESPWTKDMGADIYNYLKKLDKNVIINNRLGKGTHKVMTNETIGDYATPEQEVGEINMNYPWESCITICNQWAWKPNDKMKSLNECIQKLVSTAAGNGNLLFNVGPMMDGRMELRQVNRLKQMGAWLNNYGEAIYGTKGGPYRPNSAYAATRKGDKIYIHIFNADHHQISLPNIPNLKVMSAHFVKGANLAFDQNSTNINIQLPNQLPDENCSVIELKMNGNTEMIPLIEFQKK